MVLHDDGPAINAVIAAACPSVNSVAAIYIPAGVYNVATTIAINSCAGLRMRGETAAAGGGNTTLNWVGGPGASFVQMVKARNTLIENLRLPASAAPRRRSASISIISAAAR